MNLDQPNPESLPHKRFVCPHYAPNVCANPHCAHGCVTRYVRTQEVTVPDEWTAEKPSKQAEFDSLLESKTPTKGVPDGQRTEFASDG